MVSSEASNEPGAPEFSENLSTSSPPCSCGSQDISPSSGGSYRNRPTSLECRSSPKQNDVATLSASSAAPGPSTPERSQFSHFSKFNPCCSSSLGRAGSTGMIDVRSSSGGSERAVSASRLNDELTGTREENSARQQGEREDDPLQWLQALELQVVGACRADERLRPLLRWNVSCFGSDGRLLAHLGQHFKARELALLARCLCAPLVLIRVGKVSRHGVYLNPTTTRGYLSLTMLPCSEMRLSFLNDAGIMERIAMMNPGFESAAVTLEELREDASGRTFALRMAGGRTSFFWQSEKSKTTGDELVCKMRSLLKRRPTLAQLTGIPEVRLDSFASYLRSALCATSASLPQPSPSVQIPSLESLNGSLKNASATTPSHTSSPPLPSRLSPRFTTFKALSSLFVGTQLPAQGNVATWASSEERAQGCTRRDPAISTQSFGLSREKRRRMHGSISSAATCLTNPLGLSSSSHVGNIIGSGLNTLWSTRTSLCDKRTEVLSHSAGLYTSSQPDSQLKRQERRPSNEEAMGTQGEFGRPVCALPRNTVPFPSFISEPVPCSFFPPLSSHMPLTTSSLLAPYYCPCPLGTAALQYSCAPPFLPTTVGDTNLGPPMAPFWGVRPPPALFPPSLPGIHGLNYPLTNSLSSLPVTAPLPLESSCVSTLFREAVTHMPILNLHLPNTSHMVHHPYSRAFCTSSFVPPVLPELPRIISLPHVDTSLAGDQEDPSPLNFLAGSMSAVSSSWEELVSAAFGQISSCPVPAVPLLSENRSNALTTTGSELKGGDVPRSMEGIRVSCDMGGPTLNLRCGAYQNGRVGLGLDNLPAQQSGPLLGLVSAAVNTSNISHVLSFCPDLVSRAPTWVPAGNLDLYNHTHDLSGSSILSTGASSVSRGASTSQVISRDPPHTVLHVEPNSLADASSLLCDHRNNDDELQK